MTCEACRVAFLHTPASERAARVDAAAPNCGCEMHQAAKSSPGPVSDEEVLHLIISDPQSLLPTGYLNPAIATQIDRGGMSTLREKATDDEFIKTIEELRARSAGKGEERFFHGVLVFNTGAVRHDCGKRFLCVYDTALVDKPNHADVMAPVLEGSKSAKTRAERARIKKVIEIIGQNFVSAASFREGSFISYARPAVP